MPAVLRFGISSLDELLGVPSEKSGRDMPPGIYLPQKQKFIAESGSGGQNDDEQNNPRELFTTSVCIIGPTGTGKSIFGLHMASTYLGDCLKEIERLRKPGEPGEQPPAVVYVSTDLTHNMAQRAWSNFALNYPFSRRDPFDPKVKAAPLDYSEIFLRECNPSSLAKRFDLIETERGNVIFVDMASYTAGDDWGFLHKLLSLLPAPEADGSPRHLIVIDAIEGFEALAGELNAYGEKSTRRSRIAQVMRLIAGKCHVLLVVEQGKHFLNEESLAEEFVADTVIRLDSVSTRNYERRVIKVEKVRGQSHIRGQHHYSIRSGNGSTTGRQINPDDPKISIPDPKRAKKPLTVGIPTSDADDEAKRATPIPPDVKESRQSYVQVFHSVHRISRKIMEEEVEGRLRLPKTFYAAFGIKYLDNMLGGGTQTTTREEGTVTNEGDYSGHYYDSRGLPCRSTTALIGDSLTQKSTLGKAFLSRCFFQFDRRLEEIAALLEQSRGNTRITDDLASRIHRKVLLLSDSWTPIPDDLQSKCKAFLLQGGLPDLIEYLEATVGQWSIVAKEAREKRLDSEPELLTNLAGWLLDYRGGVAVMLVTHNTHYEELARQFISWLHSDSHLKELNRKRRGYEEALRNYIMGGTICRRLEIHSLSSEVLVHIVKQAVHAGQRKILTTQDIQHPILRYKLSWPIRIVIDDFSSLRNIFPELREDPLLLPSILFHFEREGVTTLLVDTQSGKPENTIAERFETELRQMVHHHLYTWRVPFYGESRVAITAIPPLSYEYAGIVRELRWESESTDREHSEPAAVDPHFELYSGLEEGKPEPVPLHARFYAETPAMKQYIAMENNFLNEMFSSYTSPSRALPPSVIFGIEPPGYGELQALAYLQRDTRLDHTFLFQVDEFWAMRAPGRHKRAGAFQPQWSYLNAITANSIKPQPAAAADYEFNPNEDPYELFQLRQQDPLPRKDGAVSHELRRRHFYQKYYEDFEGYEKFESEDRGKSLLDRVPFSWDFGFLLCQKRAWDTGRTFTVMNKDGSKVINVRQVWNSLRKAEYDSPSAMPVTESGETPDDGKDIKPLKYVSWRVFIEACKKAAEEQSDKLSKPITAFDFAQISPETFSSLILEMWLSEIYDSLSQKLLETREDLTEQTKLKHELDLLVKTVSKRQLFPPLANGSSGRTGLSISKLLEKYWLELYKSWLLLIEVINFSDIIGEAPATEFALKSKNTDFCAIASRHWYKTASQCPDEISTKEPLVAMRLPGHFSVRGDWFLAVSGGSRSARQGQRALDLLNSRRSNVTRLQLGIGLPTRVPKSLGPDGRSSLGALRTKLISHQRGQDSIEYETLLKIAARSTDAGDDHFHWLWRSSLDDYAEGNRIWHRWLSRTLLWWHRKLLRYRSVWRNSFEVYDALTNKPPRLHKDFTPDSVELDAMLNKIRKTKSAEEKLQLEQGYLKQYAKAHSLAQLKVRTGFLDLLSVLTEELSQACDENLDLDQK